MKKVLVSAMALGLSVIFAALVGAADLNKDDAATIAKDGMGIGAKKAEMIVADRTANGSFKDWADLQKRVKGFGIKTIEKNATTLTFGPATTTVPAATTPAATIPATVPAPAAAPAPVAPTPVAPVPAPVK